MALNYLMLLADPEPDGLVWGTFGMVADKNAEFLPAELFVGFLEHNQQFFNDNRGALMILARLPHPQIATTVRACIAKGLYDNWPDVLIRYFAKLGSEPDILIAVGLMEKNVDGFIQALKKHDRDTSNDKYWHEGYVNEIKDALKCLAAAGSFETAERRLNDLSKRLADIQIKAPQ